MRKLSFIGTLAASMVFAASCPAALVYQSEFASYAVDTAGSTTASVNIYLAQTGTTTTLSDGGGLNSVGFMVVTAEAQAPILQTIQINPAFTGNSNVSTAAGTLYAEMPDLVSGVPVIANRVLVGTLSYVGYAAVDSSTVFTIQDKPGDDTWTTSGQSLEGLVSAGNFTVAVPEPTALGLVAAGGLLILRRRNVA